MLRKQFALLICICLLGVAAAPVAAQETGILTYQGTAAWIPLRVMEDIYSDGAFFQTWPVGAIPMWLNGTPGAVPPYSDGTPIEAYCVDLFHHLGNATYVVTITPKPVQSPWQEIAYMVSQNPLAAAPNKQVLSASLQTAVWKMIYTYAPSPFVVSVLRAGANPLSPTPTDLTEENLALTLIGQALGKRLLSCEANGPVTFKVETSWDSGSPTLLTITVTASQAGLPAIGQPITLMASSGSFISPADGKGVTDATGTFVATLDLTTAISPVQILAQTVGQSVLLLDDGSYRQELIYVKPCPYEARAVFEFSNGGGDPRTIGFWKHQAAVATGNNKGNAQVPAAVLASYLPLTTFGGLQVTTLQQLYNVLWLKNASMAQRAQQQYIATLLNVAYGELSSATPVDIDYDGVPDMTFAQAMVLAQEAWDDGDYETAKSICDSINNM